MKNLPILKSKHRCALSKMGVCVLYIFGSRSMGKSGPLSDFDYAVLLPESGHLRGDGLYFELYDLLSDISKRTLKNDVIDIVFLRDVGLELKFHVVRHGVVLFEKDPNVRLDFEAETTLLYCDFRPLLDQFDTSILEAL
ncbi:MAG: nucleotidyltransferase domain-containing protein [Pseudomonadota bacterium]